MKQISTEQRDAVAIDVATCALAGVPVVRIAELFLLAAREVVPNLPVRHRTEATAIAIGGLTATVDGWERRPLTYVSPDAAPVVATAARCIARMQELESAEDPAARLLLAAEVSRMTQWLLFSATRAAPSALGVLSSARAMAVRQLGGDR